MRALSVESPELARVVERPTPEPPIDLPAKTDVAMPGFLSLPHFFALTKGKKAIKR